ncbi:hypothetical protein THIX_60463 [Thiomonas sp. X19]|nr:hypothetical protein THIX_60463 [Thiomonas sp. X19]
MRTRTVSFKMTDEDFKLIQAAARDLDLSPGQYSRFKALQDARIAELETKIDLMKADLQESFRADLRKSLEYIKQLIKGA